MGKAELLAPAGNFDALRGAINAGADAVYLGGERYGARAYADNFTAEEICEGIHFAHVFGRKIYLTVNTLVKEKELDDLYYFILPFYEKGLDGVIVQDFGVLCFLRKYFPALPLHASTQMAITGTEGAAFVKKEGISRIVPARELSLEELIFIKQKTGVEIEAFIHGAMCYCYSGQCLFSSLLGGRSGNRGRCAQPCRLPYRVSGDNRLQNGSVQKGSCYPLSMKDMCTIELLPELIEAGIDSFKIEGRMKNPSYAAGVTAVYRKYIDLYYRDKENYQVARKDKELLGSLYIRSETGEGYYRKKKGREMISLSSPAYSQTDEELLAAIRQKYIDSSLSCKAKAAVCLKAGEQAELSLEAYGTGNVPITVTCKGAVVQQAQKQPLARIKIEEQLKKSGNSLIRIEQVNIEGGENIFMPVSALNELRRNAAAALENAMAGAGRRHALPFAPSKPAVSLNAKSSAACMDPLAVPPFNESLPGREPALHVSVMTKEQLKAALAEQVGRVYVDYGLLDETEGGLAEKTETDGTELYALTPYIIREKDKKYLQKIKELLLAGSIKGVLVRNLESAAFFAENIPCSRMVLDANLYIWNRDALGFWEMYGGEFYLPMECNSHEWKAFLDACPGRKIRASAVVYGRQPMMVAANCLKKTMGKCSRKREITLLEDRYGKQFPVYSDCLCCYNVIYNSVPLSLHRQLLGKMGVDGNYRLDFTTEKEDETRQVIGSFRRFTTDSRKGTSGRGEEPVLPYKDYTTGHYKRGVE